LTSKDKSAKQQQEVVFGLYWQATPEKMGIYHDGLNKFIGSQGFCQIKVGEVYKLVRIINNVIEYTNDTDIIQCVYNHIDTLPKQIAYHWEPRHLRNLFVTGIMNYINVHKLKFLPIIEVKIHYDTKTESFFYFLNAVVRVTTNSVEMIDYKNLNACVWKSQIRPYNIVLNRGNEPAGDFKEFCFMTCGKQEDKFTSLKSVIGYLLHRYFSPSQTIVPCFLDETINGIDEANGGVGKSIICEALGYIRNQVSINGKAFKPDSDFPYQRINQYTEIIFIDDLARHVSFEFCFSIISLGLEVNQKNKPAFKIPKEKTPKIVITSNFPIKSIVGNSTDRRKLEFEIPPYFNAKHKPVDEFGRELFSAQWKDIDFIEMFNFFFECVQFYLIHGLIQPPEINEGARQLISILGGMDLKEFLDEKITDAQLKIADKKGKGLEDSTVKWNKKDLYDEFIRTYSGQQKYYPSPNKFTMKVNRYLTYRNITASDIGQRRVLQLDLSNLPPLEEPATTNDVPGQEAVNEFKTLSDFNTNYVLVNSVEKHQELLSKLKSCTNFTFDTETAATESGSALTIHSLQLVGIAFSIAVNEAYYVPIPEDVGLAAKLLAHYKPHFENPTIGKTGHNLKFDINVLRRCTIAVKGELFDTMVAHYLIDGDAKHGLKELSKNLLGYQQIEIEDLIGSGQYQLSMRDVPLEDVATYAGEDSDQTLQLKGILEPSLMELQVNTLFHDIEMPLVPVLADMEFQGIKLDGDVLLELENEAMAEVDSLTEQIFNLAGYELNLASNNELGELLFEKLNLTILTTTKTGEYSVSEQTLTKLKNEHDIITLILKYKSTVTMLNKYLSPLPNFIHPDTGKVHTHFRQDRAVTGRLSSKQPNLQNISKQIRKAFIPSDENHVIVSADYSQIELRVIAHYSNDPVMVAAFRNNEDLHTVTASKIFGLPANEVDTKKRKVAKTINFGLNYLMSAKTLAERLTKETGEGVSIAEAKEYMDSYFSEFSGVREYQEEAYHNATSTGYATTLFGRRRYLKDINSPVKAKRMAAKRLAANTPIQGTAADIIKKAMVELHRELLQNNFKTKMILQIHDELVFDVPKDELETVVPVIERVMEGAVKLIVPLKVEIRNGENWLEAH
jgi:DNA polymerase I